MPVGPPFKETFVFLPTNEKKKNEKEGKIGEAEENERSRSRYLGKK